MNLDRWRQLDAIVQRALDAPESQRARIVEDACAGDAELLAAAMGLLRECGSLEGFLDQPIQAMVPPTAEPATVGARGGAYSVVGIIASGGMGIVYEAEQANPRRTVALKLIRPGLAHPALVRRFEYEAQVLGQLQHPGIAQIFEAGTADFGSGPQPFLAMERIRGLPLTKFAQERGLDTAARLELFTKVCDAIEHAHQRGVIHRDLKPANIMVEDSGQPRIVDFGIARTLDARPGAAEPGESPRTAAGQIIGTIAYMSPEQLGGEPGAADTRADVYSLGVVLYELLAGRPPLDPGDRPLLEAIRHVASAQPPPLGEIDRGMRGDVETIVAKAIDKDPARRYQSAGALGDDIRRFLSKEPVAARPPTAAYHIARFAQRNRVLVSAAAAVALAVLAGLVGMFVLYLRVRDAQNQTQAALAAERDARGQAQLMAKEAQARRGDAEEARAQAERDADSLRKVNRFFLTGIFESAFPWRVGGTVGVIEAIDLNAHHISEAFEGDPRTEARVRHYIGNIYQELGRYKDAEEQLRLASAIWAREVGPNHDDSITTDSWLSKLLTRTGRLDEAEPLAADVLARARVGLAAYPYRIAGEAAALARIRRRRGDEAGAEALLREAVALNQKALGPISAGTRLHAQALADLLIETGRGPEADAVYRECFARQAVSDKPGGPMNHMATTFDLAAVLIRTGRVGEGIAALRELAEHPPPDWPPASDLNAEARSALGRALCQYDPAHAAEGVAILEDVLRRRSVAGPASSIVLRSKILLAQGLLAAGDAERAERVAREAFEAELPQIRSNRFHIGGTRITLAAILRRRGKLDEARLLMSDDVARTLSVRGPSHAETLTAQRRLAEVLVDSGRAQEAEPLLRDCLDHLGGETDAGRDDQARARILLAACLAAAGKYAEAESDLVAAAETLTGFSRGVADEDRELLGRVPRFFEAWAAAGGGKKAEAERWRGRLALPPSPPTARGSGGP